MSYQVRVYLYSVDQHLLIKHRKDFGQTDRRTCQINNSTGHEHLSNWICSVILTVIESDLSAAIIHARFAKVESNNLLDYQMIIIIYFLHSNLMQEAYKCTCTYWVILVHLDAVASDEGGFISGVHQQQESVQQPEGKSGEQHCPCWGGGGADNMTAYDYLSEQYLLPTPKLHRKYFKVLNLKKLIWLWSFRSWNVTIEGKRWKKNDISAWSHLGLIVCWLRAVQSSLSFRKQTVILDLAVIFLPRHRPENYHLPKKNKAASWPSNAMYSLVHMFCQKSPEAPQNLWRCLEEMSNCKFRGELSCTVNM